MDSRAHQDDVQAPIRTSNGGAPLVVFVAIALFSFRIDSLPMQVNADAEASLSIPPQQWRDDLAFLRVELPKRHKNAFHFVSRDVFESEITALDHDVDHLNGDEMFVRMKRILSSVGDGHTGLDFPRWVAQFPIWFGHFGNEYRVTAAAPENARALGARLLTIDGVPIEQIHTLLELLTPADELPPYRDRLASGMLNVAVILHGLDITATRERALFGFVNDAGEQFSVEAKAVPSVQLASADRRSAAQKTPVAAQQPKEGFWFTYLSDAHAVYCNFRRYDDLHRHVQDLLSFAERQKAAKLIIDLRQNSGGDYKKGLQDLIAPIRRSQLNQKGRLFILIGPGTFSAAMANAIHFREQTEAILVGQSIGEKPNSYAEKREMQLPNSHLTVTYSVDYYEFVKKGENVVRPDHEIPTASWEDFQTGRDAALEWIAAQNAPAGP